MIDSQMIPYQFPWPPASYKGKRICDLVVASIALCAVAPLLALIAFLVKASSPGPVLYKGRRAGHLGKEFLQMKFRTMSMAHGGGFFTRRKDPRITNIGHVLRFFKLDELPQLINVIRGEMSIVGPRPEDYDFVKDHYSTEQLRVLSAPPGLTCLLQVRIFPDFTYAVPEDADPQAYYIEKILPARIQEDICYIDTMSFGLDAKIIMLTIWCILGKSWKILYDRFLLASSEKREKGRF